MARRPSTQPTEGEIEILKVLWEADEGAATLGTVRAALQQRKAVAGTTVATMLEVMRRKGLVQRADGPQGYVWSAASSPVATRSGLLRRMIDLAFDGSAQRLVAHLFQEESLSDADRDAIQALLDSARPGPPRAGKPRPEPRS